MDDEKISPICFSITEKSSLNSRELLKGRMDSNLKGQYSDDVV